MNLFGRGTDLEEKLHGLIRIGEVCDVDYANGTARVVFDDDDSLVSNYLQVIQRNTYSNQDYAMPDIGEDVICIFLSSGMEEGFILGSVYAGDVMPPESNKDKRCVVFSDGTRISYDRATHELTAVLEGVTIKANRNSVEVVAPTITLNGNVSINGNVTATGDVVGAGKSLAKHTHTGNLGSPTSAPL